MKTFQSVLLASSLALVAAFSFPSQADAQSGSRYGGYGPSRSSYGSGSYYGNRSYSTYGNRSYSAYGNRSYSNYSGPVYHSPSLHYDRVYHADSLHWTPQRGLHTHGHYHTVPHYTPGHYDYQHRGHVHGNPNHH